MRKTTTFLEDPRAYINDILISPDPKALNLVVVHLSEKGPLSDFGHCPNVTYTYEQIKEGFSGHEVLVIPEVEGNLNWTRTAEWLSANFNDIPIAVNVFEGGFDKLPNPNVMMSVEELKRVMDVANLKAIGFQELISWYMNQTYPNVVIPTAWIHSIFDFAISNNLKIIWSEWKLGNDVEALTNSTLAGYEDKIIYVHQTNNQYQHPVIGFLYAMQFLKWGASLQSWNWKAWALGNETDMPVSIFLEHTLVGRNLGAQIIMFEPYWYFFDNNGTAQAPMLALWEII